MDWLKKWYGENQDLSGTNQLGKRHLLLDMQDLKSMKVFTNDSIRNFQTVKIDKTAAV
jgi:hypothetical protein